MVLQSTDELEEYIGNKYSLVIVAAKRARQLKEGHPALARDPSPNPLSIAMREIQERKLQPVAPPVEEIAPAPRDVIASLVAGTEFDLDEEMDLEDSDAVDDLAALLIGADEEEEDEAETEENALTTRDDTEEAEAETEEDAEEDDTAEEDDDAEEVEG